MLFWKKEKRGFEIMNERNRQYIEKMDRENADKLAAEKAAAEKAAAERTNADEVTAAAGEEANQTDNKEELSAWESADEREIAIEEARKQAEAFHKENQKMDLEKGDLPALIISAFLVFGPILLILGAILAVAWIFLH